MPLKIKRAFEKEYTGKKVPLQWQPKYGKRYSKKEADIIFYSYQNKIKNINKIKKMKGGIRKNV